MTTKNPRDTKIGYEFHRVDNSNSKDGFILDYLYHGNRILRYSNNKYTLDSCGWLTVTTKKKMNQILNPCGWFIVSEKHVWKVYKNGEFFANFQDGMQLEK